MKSAFIVLGFVVIVVAQLVALGLHRSRAKGDRNPLKWLSAMVLADVTLFFMGRCWPWLTS
jgi:hypothetical protein